MTIDEAIEIIRRWGEETEEVEEGDFSDAVQLGTEALKQLKRMRAGKLVFFNDPLPGETEE